MPLDSFLRSEVDGMCRVHFEAGFACEAASAWCWYAGSTVYASGNIPATSKRFEMTDTGTGCSAFFIMYNSRSIEYDLVC